MFQIHIDFNLLQIFFKAQINLGQLFFFNDSPSYNAKVLNSNQTCVSLISISLTSGWKTFIFCCWKISKGITILTHHTSTCLIGILDETWHLD
jgi:hypothetical protein